MALDHNLRIICVIYDIILSQLTNHQISSQGTHKVGSQSGDNAACHIVHDNCSETTANCKMERQDKKVKSTNAGEDRVKG